MTDSRSPLWLNLGFIIHQQIGYCREFPLEIPHLNLDPVRMAAVAQALSGRLVQLDPVGAPQYRERASAFAAKVDGRVQGWQKQLAGAPGVVLYHRDGLYLLDRFGEDFTKALVADKLGGFTSIDHVLASFDNKDDASQELLTADDVFVDWTITNFLNDESFADGRYAYRIYQDAPNASATETLTECKNIQLERKVHQYGTDYIRLACGQEGIDLHFSGSPTVDVLPVSTGEGYFMWSNRSDASVTSLSREFDFTNVTGPITFEFNAWYDLETDYYFLYLIESEANRPDLIVNPPSCTFSDTIGNSFGCGYNGSSYGWITEKVDLTDYAGKKITLSFEYVTDEAVTAEGFILDNVRIPEIGYETDFEVDNGGWEGEGFVRINNTLPQTFLVSIIDTYNSKEVQKYSLASGEERQGYPSSPVTLRTSAYGSFTRPVQPVVHRRGQPEPAIITQINGKEYRFKDASHKTLLRLLREDAGLIGTKEGCAEGECGACTVWMDGMAVMSCLVPAARAHNARITTIEGLSQEGALHPVQQAFIDQGAVQCGYCTPGFIMSAAMLLKEKPAPTVEEIKQAISGNLCRCTGYYAIVAAIEQAARAGSSIP